MGLAKPTWSRVLIAGFSIGGFWPATLGLLAEGRDIGSLKEAAPILSSYVQMVGGFGLVGAIGACFAFVLVRWLMTRSLTAYAASFAVIAAGIAGIWLMPAAAVDRSCHNTMRDGRSSISPVATFTLDLSMQAWRALQGEVENSKTMRANAAGTFWRMFGRIRLPLVPDQHLQGTRDQNLRDHFGDRGWRDVNLGHATAGRRYMASAIF